MKKRIIVVLSLSLVLALTGCHTVPTATSSTTTSSSSAFITQVTPPTGTVQQPASLQTGSYEGLGYMLYVPSGAKENMPMIVYLHGGSDRGADPYIMLTHDGFPLYLINGQLGQISAYVLMPQLPADKQGWEQMPETLMALVEKIAGEKKVNTEKISLTGHSMGGTGVWRIAVKYPDKFSCFVPMSGNARLTDQNLQALRSSKIWAFVGDADTVIDPMYTTRFMAELSLTNPNCQLTVIEGATHYQVPRAYYSTTYQVVQWMLNQ